MSETCRCVWHMSDPNTLPPVKCWCHLDFSSNSPPDCPFTNPLQCDTIVSLQVLSIILAKNISIVFFKVSALLLVFCLSYRPLWGLGERKATMHKFLASRWQHAKNKSFIVQSIQILSWRVKVSDHHTFSSLLLDVLQKNLLPVETCIKLITLTAYFMERN